MFFGKLFALTKKLLSVDFVEFNLWLLVVLWENNTKLKQVKLNATFDKLEDPVKKKDYLLTLNKNKWFLDDLTNLRVVLEHNLNGKAIPFKYNLVLQKFLKPDVIRLNWSDSGEVYFSSKFIEDKFKLVLLKHYLVNNVGALMFYMELKKIYLEIEITNRFIDLGVLPQQNKIMLNMGPYDLDYDRFLLKGFLRNDTPEKINNKIVYLLKVYKMLSVPHIYQVKDEVYYLVNWFVTVNNHLLALQRLKGSTDIYLGDARFGVLPKDLNFNVLFNDALKLADLVLKDPKIGDLSGKGYVGWVKYETSNVVLKQQIALKFLPFVSLRTMLYGRGVTSESYRQEMVEVLFQKKYGCTSVEQEQRILKEAALSSPKVEYYRSLHYNYDFDDRDLDLSLVDPNIEDLSLVLFNMK